MKNLLKILTKIHQIKLGNENSITQIY